MLKLYLIIILLYSEIVFLFFFMSDFISHNSTYIFHCMNCLSVCFWLFSSSKSKPALIARHLIRIHAGKLDISVGAAHLHRFAFLLWVRKSLSNSSDKTNPSDSLIREHNTWEKRTVSGTKWMGQKDLLLGFVVEIWPWGRDDQESTVGHFSRFRF